MICIVHMAVRWRLTIWLHIASHARLCSQIRGVCSFNYALRYPVACIAITRLDDDDGHLLVKHTNVVWLFVGNFLKINKIVSYNVTYLYIFHMIYTIVMEIVLYRFHNLWIISHILLNSLSNNQWIFCIPR